MAQIVEPTQEAIREAANRLRNGEVVAFPTETVYGLGANTLNVTALERIYSIKHRPVDNPLIAHVLDTSHAMRLVTAWDERSEKLAEKFWPGPLTLVLPKSDHVPVQATAGYSTIALRAPTHPVARNLLETFGSPISAPSANRSGGISPTTATHVADDFSECDDLFILDGGSCQIGIESTVIDLSTETPRVIRLGAITRNQLQIVLGEVEMLESMAQVASPGTSASHYSPSTPMELLDTSELKSALEHSTSPVVVLCIDQQKVKKPHVVINMPRQAEEYAASLYAALRQADSMGRSRILVELPPTEGELWAAIHDRLSRAVKKGP